MPRKKKDEGPPTVCGKCAKSINRFEVMNALMNGLRYEHTCGKVLVYGDDSLKVEDVRDV